MNPEVCSLCGEDLRLTNGPRNYFCESCDRNPVEARRPISPTYPSPVPPPREEPAK